MPPTPAPASGTPAPASGTVWPDTYPRACFRYGRQALWVVVKVVLSMPHSALSCFCLFFGARAQL